MTRNPNAKSFKPLLAALALAATVASCATPPAPNNLRLTPPGDEGRPASPNTFRG